MKDKINSLIVELREEITFQSDDGFCRVSTNSVEDIIKILEESKEEIERLEADLDGFVHGSL